MTKNQNIRWELLDPIQARKIDDSNRNQIYKEIVESRKNEIYETTDHFILVAHYGNIAFVSISLDTSTRSNLKGYPLSSRIDGICILINKILNLYDHKCVFFFSEACRPNFYGDRDNRKNQVEWLDIRNIIECKTGLMYLTEMRNDDDYEMSFGVAAFCGKNARYNIKRTHLKRLTTIGQGTVAVGIVLNDEIESTVYSTYFPHDFQNQAESNHLYVSMKELVNFMGNRSNAIMTLGDFNTIPGIMSDSVHNAIECTEYKLLLENEITFMGAHYDKIKENRVLCIDTRR